MNITCSIQGVAVSLEEIQKLPIDSDTINRICSNVRNRIGASPSDDILRK